jgi:lysophospholipase L1-like esterase
MGPGYGSVSQNINSSPLLLFWFDAYLKVSDGSNSGFVTVGFYDADSMLIMKYRSQPVTDTLFKETGIYFETPALTKYIQIGIQSGAGNTGYVYGDKFSWLIIYPDPVNSPECDLAQYMVPFWQADTIFNETVLLYQTTNDTAPNGKLLFMPEKIIGINNFGQENNFLEGKDFIIKDRNIIKINPAMLSVKNEDLDHKNYNWNELQSKWVTVNYIPEKNSWKGPDFPYKGDNMPKTMRKLKTGNGITIVAIGMSITRGMNVSSYDQVTPFMPNYINLFANELKKKYDCQDFQVVNAGMPGSNSEWLSSYADRYVNPYNPDLVIIDMGMNDFWSIDAKNYKSNIQTAIDRIKAGCPDAEFLLISNMLFDKDYITDGTLDGYFKRLRDYNKSLQSMESVGIINLDMTTVSDTIYQLKKPKDCLTNPLHPNDYMARWYAQGMVALFDTSNIQNPVNINEKYSGHFSFEISPNPVENRLFSVIIPLLDSNSGTELTIFDIKGRCIYRSIQDSVQKEYFISTLKMDQGLFLVCARNGSNQSCKEIIIK